MGIFDSIDRNYKNYRSKRNEAAKLEAIRAEMEKKNLVIQEQLQKIGQYYWRLYYDGEYAPGEDLEYFTTIDKCNEELKYLSKRADNLKVVGMAERTTIEKDSIDSEKARREKAERRRDEKRAEAERRRTEKAERKAEAKRRKEEKASDGTGPEDPGDGDAGSD